MHFILYIQFTYIMNYCSVKCVCVCSKNVPAMNEFFTMHNAPSCSIQSVYISLPSSVLFIFLFARSTRRYHNKMYQVEELVIHISFS